MVDIIKMLAMILIELGPHQINGKNKTVCSKPVLQFQILKKGKEFQVRKPKGDTKTGFDFLWVHCKT